MNWKLPAFAAALIATLLILPLGGLFAEGEGASQPASGTETVQVKWHTDFAAAMAQAQKENKRVLIDFTGSDWCHWCIRMEKETLSTRPFKEYADAHLILFKADFPNSRALPEAERQQNEALTQRYRVEGFPCFVVIDPQGRELDRRAGYVRGGPQNFIAFLKVSENFAQK
jgi:thioredoxin-related protein